MPQYNKTVWVNDGPPAIDSTNLNKIEQGIFDSLRQDGSTTMSGQLVTTAGTVTTPAIAPTGDANTGIFFPAADTTAFSTNGSERVRINSSGNVGIGTTPSTWGSGYTALSIKNAGNSISSSGTSQLLLSSNAYDSGTGAWKYNDSGYFANVMEIGSNGYVFYTTQSTQGADNPITWSERMRITTAGNIGIGTANPAEKLVVNGNISSLYGIHSTTLFNGNLNFYNAGSATKYINVSDDASTIAAISLDKIGSATKTCFLNGNVGIGTTNPSGRLTIRGATGTSGKNQGILIEYSNGTEYGALGLNDSTGWPQLMARAGAGLTFHTNSDLLTSGEAMRITSAGNVGIGTTSPNMGAYGATAKVVTVLSSTGFGVHELASGVTPADSNVLGVVSFINNGSGIITPVGTQIVGFQSGSHATYPGGKLIFYTRANGSTSLSERLTITDSGNVGIGTTSPNKKFTVYSSNNSYDESIQVVNTGSLGGSVAGIKFYTENSTAAFTGFVVGKLPSGDGHICTIWNENNSAIQIGTNNLERMRITSAGNVGIGTTSPSSILHISSAIASYAPSLRITNTGTGSDQQSVIALYTDNATTTNQFLIGKNSVAGGADTFLSNQANSAMIFETNATARMRITSTGYLLIGYTSSNGAYPLQVNGQIFATSSTIATSDGRYKKDVVSLDGALDIVKALNPVQFSWKDHPVHKFNTDVPTVGFIAQEVEQALADKSYLTSIIKKSECTWETETGEFVEREVTRDVEKQVTREVEREITETIDGEEVTRTITEEVTETIIEQVTEIVTEPVKETHTEEFLGIAESNLIAILTKAVKELAAKVEALEAQLNK